jgi:UDP-glucuronate 4-epimerase
MNVGVVRILITGAAGFIGSHLTDRLVADGHAVTALDCFDDYYDPRLKRQNVARWGNAVPLVEADIRDAAALRPVFQAGKFDVVLHLAARAGVRASLANPQLFAEVNVVGTQVLLELAREFGVRQFILASSSSVYGESPDVPFREDNRALLPVSPYAATKLAAEALAHVYHHLFQLDVVCLRFFTVYGPRQRPDLAIHKFTAAILAGRPIELYGDGGTQRDYTYVDDIVAGVRACVGRSFGYEIVNLGESRTVALRELVTLIEQAAGRPAQIRRLPPQPGDVPRTYADISKARRLIGYDPQVPIEEGIVRFVEWFKRTH